MTDRAASGIAAAQAERGRPRGEHRKEHQILWGPVLRRGARFVTLEFVSQGRSQRVLLQRHGQREGAPGSGGSELEVLFLRIRRRQSGENRRIASAAQLAGFGGQRNRSCSVAERDFGSRGQQEGQVVLDGDLVGSRSSDCCKESMAALVFPF